MVARLDVRTMLSVFVEELPGHCVETDVCWVIWDVALVSINMIHSRIALLSVMTKAGQVQVSVMSSCTRCLSSIGSSFQVDIAPQPGNVS
jgi:hypothetical protein